MLTGLERFVRIVVERETLVPRSQAPPEAKTRCIVISYKGGGGGCNHLVINAQMAHRIRISG